MIHNESSLHSMNNLWCSDLYKESQNGVTSRHNKWFHTIYPISYFNRSCVIKLQYASNKWFLHIFYNYNVTNTCIYISITENKFDHDSIQCGRYLAVVDRFIHLFIYIFSIPAVVDHCTPNHSGVWCL